MTPAMLFHQRRQHRPEAAMRGQEGELVGIEPVTWPRAAAGRRRWPALLVVAITLSSVPAYAIDYGRNPAPLFQLGSEVAGQSPAHALSFSTFRGELETYRAVVTYPDGFRFKGFDALGPAGVEVGALTLDFEADGTAALIVPLRSLSFGSAYADVIPDGRFSPGLEPVLRHSDAATFVLRLPLGGDANAATRVAPFDSRVTLVLLAGLITSPRQAGTYVITAELLSVDPDTDDADDGVGAPPMALAFDVTQQIVPPPVTPFASLCIDRADIAEDHAVVHGRYVLGSASDGARIPADTVVVGVAEFEQSIPGSAFSVLGQGVQFRSRAAGVKRLLIERDGNFQLDLRDVDVSGIDRAHVVFSLQIGDDRGEAEIAFDFKGRFRRRGPPCRP
jgi:hypothetical protein